jgi:hypothetical protein
MWFDPVIAIYLQRGGNAVGVTVLGSSRKFIKFPTSYSATYGKQGENSVTVEASEIIGLSSASSGGTNLYTKLHLSSGAVVEVALVPEDAKKVLDSVTSIIEQDSLSILKEAKESADRVTKMMDAFDGK